jgi:hypothetical protein
MNPIWKNMPDFSTELFISATSASDNAGGFSQKVGFLLMAAAITCSRWMWVGVTMTIASTVLSSIIASGSVYDLGTSNSSAISLARLPIGSATATSLVSGIRPDKSRA